MATAVTQSDIKAVEAAQEVEVSLQARKPEEKENDDEELVNYHQPTVVPPPLIKASEVQCGYSQQQQQCHQSTQQWSSAFESFAASVIENSIVTACDQALAGLHPSPIQQPARNRQQLEKPRKHVSFGIIEIHRHRLILGDNPGVSNGVPLALEWKELGPVETFPVPDSDASRRMSIDATSKLNDTDNVEAKLGAGERAPKFPINQRYMIALRTSPKSVIMKQVKSTQKIQKSRQKSKQDTPEDMLKAMGAELLKGSTTTTQRQQIRRGPPKKKRLWWYHGR